jgi:hypothetical protein
MGKPALQQIGGRRVGPPGESVQRGGPRVCLVTALTVADFIDPALTHEAHSKTGAQLGVLTLAALLRQEGFDPHVVQLDDLFYDFIRRRGSSPECADYFFPFAAEHLRPLDFDLYGFSSICSTYPLTLRLAGEVRRSVSG